MRRAETVSLVGATETTGCLYRGGAGVSTGSGRIGGGQRPAPSSAGTPTQRRAAAARRETTRQLARLHASLEPPPEPCEPGGSKSLFPQPRVYWLFCPDFHKLCWPIGYSLLAAKGVSRAERDDVESAASLVRSRVQIVSRQSATSAVPILLLAIPEPLPGKRGTEPAARQSRGLLLPC